MTLFANRYERLERAAGVALRQARSNGVETTGALVVSHSSSHEDGEQELIVFPDRIELHVHGRRCLDAARVERLPIRLLQSVDSRIEDGWAILTVRGAGQTMTCRTDPLLGPKAHQVIIAAMLTANASASLAVPSSTAAPVQLLRRLLRMREAGLLTERQFSETQRAILRGRTTKARSGHAPTATPSRPALV